MFSISLAVKLLLLILVLYALPYIWLSYEASKSPVYDYDTFSHDDEESLRDDI